MSNEILRCKVADDSTYEDLRGEFISVIREKAFYKVVDSPIKEYIGDLIGREQLKFNVESSIPEFPTGAKRDSEGKEDFIETMSFLAERRYAQYMTSKAKTYGPGNWRKGIPIESYERSLRRHINKYLANKYDNANIEPDEDHLSAALFNLLGIIHEEERIKLNNK